MLFDKMVASKIPRLENHCPSLDQNPSFATSGNVQKLWRKFPCLCCICVQGEKDINWGP